MSTFTGKIAEIEGISVDRFDGANLKSKAFFLSHCHTDHMRGLSPDFCKKLIEEKLYLYLSHVSAAIIKKMFPDMLPELAERLMELEIGSSTIVSLSSGKSFSVIPISAGHCPGSVMFLFEADETVLYTGDYRIKPSDLPKFSAFYNSMNVQKNIQSVYLDTTFFLKRHLDFPSRAESVEETCKIITEWLSYGDNYVINLMTSAKYGYEFLFIEIYKRLKIPIHVSDEAYRFYSKVPEMDHAVTRSEDTKIHSACGITYTEICYANRYYKVKNLKVSAWRWTSQNIDKGISEKSYGTHYVCFSTHASYTEGRGLLKFLNPKNVYPSVLPNPVANEEIYKNIEEILGSVEPSPKKVKLFYVKDDEDPSNNKTVAVTNEYSCILDSPPRDCTS